MGDRSTNNNNLNSSFLDELQESIEPDPAAGDFIVWGDKGQILSRQPTREDALREAAKLKRKREASIDGNKVRIDGEILPMSEYARLSSMQEYH